MNNIYRVIWNASLCLWQAVSEVAKSAGKTRSLATGSSMRSAGSSAHVGRFAISGLAMACAVAHANLPVISQGQGAVTGASLDATVVNKLVVNQTAPKAILNWESFNVGAGKTVQFVQPDSSAIALNRVVGASGAAIARSTIDGTITANGQVFLINPTGITFGNGSQVNVGGIVASTRDIADADFLASAGKYNFTVGSDTNAADVVNNGKITALNYAVLIGAKVVNKPATGTTKTDAEIKAPMVSMAAGDDILLQLDGTLPAIAVTKSNASALIENGGLVVAANGKIYLTAGAVNELLTSAINNVGVIEADTLSVHGGSVTISSAGSVEAKSGAVVMKATGAMTINGTVKSSHLTNGGSIELSAKDMTLDVNSLLDASGAVAGKVETTSAKVVTVKSGAQVKTLKDASTLGTWTVNAGDVYVTTEVTASGPTDKPYLVSQVNLLNTDQTVNANTAVGDVSSVNAAVGSGASATTKVERGSGWNIVVADNLIKPEAAKQALPPSTTQVLVPQDVTLTLVTDRDISVNSNITSSSNRGRLNVVLQAGGDVNVKGIVTTNGGNFYVGAVTPGTADTKNPDVVAASGRDFTVDGKVDVGTGYFSANVNRTIAVNKDGSINKSGSTGKNNATKYADRGGFWGYKPNTDLALTTNLDVTAANITGGGDLSATSSATVSVKAGSIGTPAAPLSIKSATTLNVTNDGTGGTYIKNAGGYFNTLTLTTTGSTDGVQSIVMANQADGSPRQVVGLADATSDTLKFATGGVNATDLTNLTIKAPHILLDPGSISSKSLQTSPDPSDPSLRGPNGPRLTLSALSGATTYGSIQASSAADPNKAAEISIPSGTVVLEAKNIGTDGINSGANFVNAPAVNTTVLNIENYGGSTWLANSEYNRLNFQSTGTGAGWHHILSKNGDFFNVETTADARMVVYSIDRLDASSSPTSRLSGVYTRSTPGAHKNITLETGNSISRDIVFMNDSVDLGAATLSLTASGGKVIQGSWAKLLQNDANAFSGALTNSTAGSATAPVPHLTLGNLKISLTAAGSSIGAGGYDLKVAKGGVKDPGTGVADVNFDTNKLDITSQGGDIAIRELSPAHFKDIKIVDTTVNKNATVNLELNDNFGVDEKLVYQDTTNNNGLLSLNTGGGNVVALSGYDRNLTLTVSNKNIQIGSFGNDTISGTSDKKIGSGSLTISAKAMSLGGDIITTSRGLSTTTGFDEGNVSLTATEFKLSGDVKIDTKADRGPSAAERKPGEVKMLSATVSRAVALSGHGRSLTIDTSSSDPTKVVGGAITTQFVAMGTASDALKDLIFVSNRTGLGGAVSLQGNQYDISGNFEAAGNVTFGGALSTTANTDPDFSIRTNLDSTASSGSITFGGRSFSMTKGYGDAVLDTSVTGARTAGNISLWNSGMTAPNSFTPSSQLSAGNWTINASNATDPSKSGEVAVDNVSATGLPSYSTLSYGAANLLIKAKSATLAGNLTTTSGGATGSQVNTGDVTLDAGTVTIAEAVKIRTFGGFTGGTTTPQVGQAGNVVLGKAGGATLVVDGKSLEIDANAGVTTSNYTARHGSITLNASVTDTAKSFKDLTLIGSGVTGTPALRATGQMTLGLLDQPSVMLTAPQAGSLLLLGTGTTTDFTITDAKVGALAASGVKSLTFTTDASFTDPLLIKSLSYSSFPAVFTSPARGISASGAVSLTSKASPIVVEAAASVKGEAVTLKSDSTDATKGGIELKASTSTIDGGAKEVELITQAGNITIAQGAKLKSTLASGRAVLLSAGVSDAQDGHVVLAGTGPTFDLATDAHAVIYTGHWSEAQANSNTAYSALGVGHYTYGVTQAPTSFVPAVNTLHSASQKTYAFFRGDAPEVALAFGPKVYNGLGFELNSATAGNSALSFGQGGGLLFGDKTAYDQGNAQRKADITAFLLGLEDSKISITQDGQSVSLADAKNAGNYVVAVNAASAPTFGYQLKTPGTGTSNYEITPAPLTVSFSGQAQLDKVYDGTDSASLNPSSDLVLSGMVKGETITIGKPAAGQYGYTDANSTWTVSSQVREVTSVRHAIGAGDLVFGQGAQAGNYSLGATTLEKAAAITPAPLTVAFVASQSNFDKVYDASQTGAVTPAKDLVLTGVAKGDSITIGNVNAGEYGALDSQGKWVASSQVKKVDTLQAAIGIGDLVYANVDASNYSFSDTTVQKAAVIKPAPLSVAFSSQANFDKVYDASSTATVKPATDLVLSGVVAGDVITIGNLSPGQYGAMDAQGQWAMSSQVKKVDTFRATVGNGDLVYSNVDASNYSFVDATLQKAATITPATLSVAFSPNARYGKVYDGASTASLKPATDLVLSGVVNGETVSIGDVTTGQYGYNNASATWVTSGDAKKADTFRATLSFGDLVFSNAEASNYKLPDGVAQTPTVITPAPLSVRFADGSGFNKVYDGSPSGAIAPATDFVVMGVIKGEAISVGNVTTGQYGYTDVSGTWVPSSQVTQVREFRGTVATSDLVFSKADAGNYSLVGGTAQKDASIAAKPLIVTATVSNKPFDGKVDAEAALSFDRTKLVGIDQVNAVFTKAEFASSSVGLNKPVKVEGVELAGKDASNYVVTPDGIEPTSELTTTASILPVEQAPVRVVVPAPIPVPLVSPNLGNAPVLSFGGLAVVNMASTTVSGMRAQGTSTPGNAIPAAAISVDTAQPNMIYVLDGGIKAND